MEVKVGPSLQSSGEDIPVTVPGLHSIFAFGKCSNGLVTTYSNVLWVFSASIVPTVVPAPLAPSPTAALFILRYRGISARELSEKYQQQVCDNIKQLQPGGACEILTVLPGSAIVTGTVTYSTSQQANGLVQKLGSTSSSSTLLNGIEGATTVQTEAAKDEPAPPTPSAPDAPTDIVAQQYNGDCPVAALDVSFTPPEDKKDIISYLVTCNLTSAQ
jgi:hypothetical protein